MGLSKVITNVVVPPVILGDSAYGLTNWLMRPFTDRGNLTNEELAFNTAHSKTRVVVENAFGWLKGRFKSLGKRLDHSFENATTTVTACCVRHNYCEVMKEEFHEEWLEFSSVQFILFALINHDYNNYNNNYAFGRQSRKLFCSFKGLPWRMK